MRRLLALLLVAGLVAGCSTSPTDGTTASEAASRTAVLEELRGRLATVADTQADADEALNEVLEPVRRVDEALVEARTVLDDEWEVSYLDAQDEVLVAVRDYARVADRLAQLVVRHWPTYEEIDAIVVDVAQRRGNYRDTGEAMDALAVELDPLMGDLATAQRQLADYRDRREEAGRAVNEATADAVTVYEQRPAGEAVGQAP